MYSPLQNAISFLLGIFFPMYIYTVLLRIIFQIMRVNFYNPVAQFIVKITNPTLIPLRRIIPGYRGYDIAAFVLVILLQLIFILLSLLISGNIPTFSTNFCLGISIWTIGALIAMVFGLYIYLVIISIILSWVMPMSPVSSVLNLLTEPLLSPIRRRVPPIGMFDLSPLIFLIGIQLCQILISSPITKYGQDLMRHW